MTHTAVEAGTRAFVKVAARHNAAVAPELVEDTVRAVLAAQESAMGRPVERDGIRLTGRRLEALKLAAQGCSNAEIGARMYITEDTVKTTMRHVYAALGVHDRAHAVALGFAYGLLRPADVLQSKGRAA